jgi:hypothetical protein
VTKEVVERGLHPTLVTSATPADDEVRAEKSA